ncbi:hypothetical protein COO91_09639 (plasmid) [Nostoc flagelliforme CCNUN1]|uniref:Uncharacterized protein n=1 Tax=Nostoc flagelliforme CCNUN1 TaxID=2038116 RepID=A0A2K8T6X9_9NOSO|nr:hypothetical protein COO91_09639 [Nostoc flagelliforme CCNUN1]
MKVEAVVVGTRCRRAVQNPDYLHTTPSTYINKASNVQPQNQRLAARYPPYLLKPG